MTLFWTLASALIIISLLFVVPGLMRGIGTSERNRKRSLKRELAEVDRAYENGIIDVEAHQEKRDVIARQLLESIEDGEASETRAPLAALFCTLLVTIGAISLYQTIGQPAAITASGTAPAAASPSGSTIAGTETTPQPAMPIEEAIRNLESKLEADPSSVENWFLLARSYQTTGRQEDARDAYHRAYLLDPENPDINFGYAEAIAAASGSELIPERSIVLLESLLDSHPEYGRALFMLALARSQQGERDAALALLERLYETVDPADEQAVQLLSLINSIREQMQLPAYASNGDAEPVRPVTNQASTTAATNGLTVNLSLDAGFTNDVEPDETLYVFAKAVNGPPMPLAVQRLTVSSLPATIRLDDSMAMVEGMQMSRFETIYVEARISRLGTPQAQPGDLQATSDPITLPASDPLSLVIDTRISQ